MVGVGGAVMVLTCAFSAAAVNRSPLRGSNTRAYVAGIFSDRRSCAVAYCLILPVGEVGERGECVVEGRPMLNVSRRGGGRFSMPKSRCIIARNSAALMPVWRFGGGVMAASPARCEVERAQNSATRAGAGTLFRWETWCLGVCLTCWKSKGSEMRSLIHCWRVVRGWRNERNCQRDWSRVYDRAATGRGQGQSFW